MSLLEVRNINTGYGKKQVLFNVSLDVEEGETVLLVGSNGSGKSTLFKAIYGVIPIWNGGEPAKVLLDGVDVTNVKSHNLIKSGIMYVPQTNEFFEDMTVEENLRMALIHLNDKKEAKNRVAEMFPQITALESKKNQLASKLSGGERKLLSLGMVLVNRPRIVLYDEPLAGLSGNNIVAVSAWLERMKLNGTTLVLIEHRIKELLKIADKVVGLKLGRTNRGKLENLERIKSFIL